MPTILPLSAASLPELDDSFNQVFCPAGYIPAKPRFRWCLAVDLGQQRDHTAALAIRECCQVPVAPLDVDENTLRQVVEPDFCEVRLIRRLPLGMSYVHQVRYIENLMASERVLKNARLVIDHSGVGAGIYDLFCSHRLKPVGIRITSGTGWTRTPTGFNVSKSDLVSKLIAMYETGEFRIDGRLPETPLLINELANFKATISEATGYVSYSAREGENDDLVLGAAIGVWWLTNRAGSFRVLPFGHPDSPI